MTPDLLYDQMIGMGAARRLVFSYGGNPGVGSLHRFRDAIENGWPRPLEIEEHSHAGMANRYVGRRRGPAVRDPARLRRHRPASRTRTSSAIDVPVHRRAARRRRRRCARTSRSSTPRRPTAQGNVQLWGIPGVQKEAVLAAKRSLVTVERIVDELEPRPGGVVIPGWAIDAVAEAPRRLAAVLRLGHHRARQRLLPRVGRDQPRPRRVPRLDGRARAVGKLA